MDLIIKNLEKLQDYHTKEGKHPIERLVLDFDKLSEMKDFTKIFEKSCEKYNETEEGLPLCNRCKYQFVEEDKDPCKSCLDSAHRKLNWEPKEPNLKEVPNEDIIWRMSLERKCINCKYGELDSTQEPCKSCFESYHNRLNWEPKEPNLKEVTERMQSEFDATGKDVKIFMNERVIKR